MSEYTNGRDTQGSTTGRGRVPPAYPSLTLPKSGYTVECRRLPTGLPASLNAQAHKELEAERPQPPVQTVEVGPGERPGDPPQTREVARESDPDHLKALAEWEGRVRQAGALKLLRVIQNYAVLTPTDEDAVAAYRAAVAGEGMALPNDDREVFMWSIVAPTQEDHEALVAFVLGLSEVQREAIKAQAATFRRSVAGPTAGAVADAGGQGQL